mmetsp:Transcript_53477/g.168354  ORF Transcript_53477/g.168354 Transcript_53477/m.168354 type:complete len:220 (+) Transcript_53477:205-864(+)
MSGLIATCKQSTQPRKHASPQSPHSGTGRVPGQCSHTDSAPPASRSRPDRPCGRRPSSPRSRCPPQRPVRIARPGRIHRYSGRGRRGPRSTPRSRHWPAEDLYRSRLPWPRADLPLCSPACRGRRRPHAQTNLALPRTEASSRSPPRRPRRPTAHIIRSSGAARSSPSATRRRSPRGTKSDTPPICTAVQLSRGAESSATLAIALATGSTGIAARIARS